MRTIKLFDAQGKEIHSEQARSNAKRWSMQAAADQKQIDAARAKHPAAVRAELVKGASTFRFNFDAAGRSQVVFS